MHGTNAIIKYIYVQKHVIWNKLNGEISADVQGQQANCPFVQDSAAFKSAAILGSCVWHTQCVYVMVPKIGMRKCSKILQKHQKHYYKVKCLEYKCPRQWTVNRQYAVGRWGGARYRTTAFSVARPFVTLL